MIDAFRLAFPYLRTVWENDTYEAYFDGHISGSRHAWRKAGKEGERPDGRATTMKPYGTRTPP